MDDLWKCPFQHTIVNNNKTFHVFKFVNFTEKFYLNFYFFKNEIDFIRVVLNSQPNRDSRK